MWITQNISKKRDRGNASFFGSVVSNAEGLEVSESATHRNLPIVMPFGVSYVPSLGENVVVLETEGGPVCIGVLNTAAKELKSGELKLYSKGGASITLKNDGTVNIEGNVFINGVEVSL